MVTQNHFVIPATVLEKFRSRGFPRGCHSNRRPLYLEDEEGELEASEEAKVVDVEVEEDGECQGKVHREQNLIVGQKIHVVALFGVVWSIGLSSEEKLTSTPFFFT